MGRCRALEGGGGGGGGGGLAVRRVYIHLVRCEVLVEQELVLETNEAADLQREVHIGGLHWRPLFWRGCRLMGRLSVLGGVGWIFFLGGSFF